MNNLFFFRSWMLMVQLLLLNAALKKMFCETFSAVMTGALSSASL